MIGMLKGWRIGRILVRKKIGLLKQGLLLVFDELGSTNGRCYAKISKHICD
jgi:hypothetical protein